MHPVDLRARLIILRDLQAEAEELKKKSYWKTKAFKRLPFEQRRNPDIKAAFTAAHAEIDALINDIENELCEEFNLSLDGLPVAIANLNRTLSLQQAA